MRGAIIHRRESRAHLSTALGTGRAGRSAGGHARPMNSASAVVGVIAALTLVAPVGMLTPISVPSTPGSVQQHARWRWPLDPRPGVLRRFERPATAYGPGHRGLDLGGTQGQRVSAVADGIVSHAGVIDGRGTVSVTHANGLRSTYEPIDAIVKAGDAVKAGDLLGHLTSGGHCGPAACLHLGALRGRNYLDPLILLAPGRVILLPLHD